MFSEALGPVAGARWTRQHGTQAMCHLSADLDSVVRNLLSNLPLLTFPRRTPVLEVSAHCGVAAVEFRYNSFLLTTAYLCPVIDFHFPAAL